jgi:hypothetical protein
MKTPSKDVSEGRAIAARPSLCLLLLACAVFLAASVTQAAAAEPPIPKLGGTNPISPSTSLTPRVYGSADGISISSFPGISLRGVRTSSVDPNNTIQLFSDAGCSAEIGHGSPLEFDDANTGIAVTVAADTTTSIYANETESGVTSKCSSPISYVHMTHVPDLPQSESPPSGGGSGGGAGTPPTGSPPAVGPNQTAVSPHPAPPHLKTVPGGSANQNSILLTGTAPGAGAVRIFTNSDCSGPPVAKGPASHFADGFALQVVDNTTTSFYGVSVGSGGAPSGCSDPVTYVEDSIVPRTRITLGPASKTRNRSPVFRFTDITGDAPGTAFYCKVDKRKWKVCRTPLHLRKLKLRSHLLRVKAVDPAGNAEVTGAKRRFKVVPRP